VTNPRGKKISELDNNQHGSLRGIQIQGSYPSMVNVGCFCQAITPAPERVSSASSAACLGCHRWGRHPGVSKSSRQTVQKAAWIGVLCWYVHLPCLGGLGSLPVAWAFFVEAPLTARPPVDPKVHARPDPRHPRPPPNSMPHSTGTCSAPSCTSVWISSPTSSEHPSSDRAT
jgi:hypothetical protein